MKSLPKQTVVGVTTILGVPGSTELLLFTFGFHGYIESIQGIHKNIVNKIINDHGGNIKFTSKDTGAEGKIIFKN